MSIKCELTELTPQPALTIRVRTSAQYLPQIFENGFREIKDYIKEFKQQAAGYTFAKYYNLDLRDLDVEFGIPILRSFSGRDNIQASETPGGKCVTCLHVGPYRDVELSYHALTEWIKNNGYESSGIAYEVYLNDPLNTPEEKLETQIYEMIMPVELSANAA
jgi:effector-binding domain-containing protein